jgi:hypothetical protein
MFAVDCCFISLSEKEPITKQVHIWSIWQQCRLASTPGQVPADSENSHKKKVKNADSEKSHKKKVKNLTGGATAVQCK